VGRKPPSGADSPSWKKWKWSRMETPAAADRDQNKKEGK